MFLSSRTRVFSRDQRGSLLIEVLVSVVVLSTALTFIIESMTASLRSIQYGAGYTTALVLLDNQMCEVLRKGFIESGLRETRNLTESSPVYHYSLQTKSLSATAKDNINQVDMTVSWRSGKKDNQISVTTFLFTASP